MTIFTEITPNPATIKFVVEGQIFLKRGMAVFLSEVGVLVKPLQRLQVVADEPDNRILECAVAGHAGAIVTGDKALLDVSEHDGVKIISLRAYLAE